ncbi:MAG: helix-turn-helix transcriptional regulator [Brevundimonas sp.]|uniref:helix-turn-helix domain-containing protein n=1 Tax=Brevundimonas sp. TaxID=1871086 RepID=UPI00248817CD|nr:helix-turn-helix transcriptional regulator [Brevundimonas sp.]MDI1326982.1 helix-turn-helix transcriptional regulator [Brevundimonas sp.]
MSSPKSRPAIERLGRDIRGARLRRGMTVADLAIRAGASPSTLARLEKGDVGVALGTLADVLVVLGLIERLADLIDIRNDDLGLALAGEQTPKRGRSQGSMHRRKRVAGAASKVAVDVLDPDGAAF